MNRKDTILVAVLINAGVLVVLFTSALKNKHTDQSLDKESEVMFVPEARLEPLSIMKDEIDLAIEQVKKDKAQEAILAQSPEGVSGPLTAVVVQTPVSSEPSFMDVSVKKGDFLAKIAKRHQVTVEAIMKANHLKNTNLRIGQVLKIPQVQGILSVTESAPAEKTQKVETKPALKYYVIRAGDNPWVIAQKHKMKVDELLKLNHLTPEKAKQLKVGDKLKVKG